MARFGAFYSDSDDDASSSSSPPRPARKRPTNRNGKSGHQRAYTAARSSDSSTEESAEVDSYIGDEGEGISDAEEDDSATQQEADEEAEPTAWPKQLNLEPRKVNVMQSSLFRMPELEKVHGKDSYSFLKKPIDLDPLDLLGERKLTRNRTSFTQPQSQSPPRKYVRVSLKDSVSASNEKIFFDAGLSMGRSFRVGWGPGNRLVHVGHLINRDSPSPEGNSSTVHITTLRDDEPKSPDLLEYLLNNSEMAVPSEENDYTPSASINPDITFSSFSSLFTAQDESHCASVFRLCHALFDPIDLHLEEDVPPETRSCTMALRRAEALSSWLARAVASSVEKDVKNAPSSDSAHVAFLYLTGYQIEKATEVLMDGKNFRLATIVAQIPGDEVFRTDNLDQLEIWREEKADVFVSEYIRRLYALGAGILDVLDGSSRDKDVDIAKGLDWLRVLGLVLWYSHPLGAPLEGTFASYENYFSVNSDRDRLGFPTPWYSQSPAAPQCTEDGLFNLMKLSLTPTMALESALDPLSFSPNPRDYRIPWFLYMLLSRCLRVRDFADRQVSVTADADTGVTQEVEGYSQVANILTTNFAAQLEQEGLVQQAVYVLFFLEDEAIRKSAIRDLLSRSGPLLSDHNTSGLTMHLRIPTEWVDEAKATHAFYTGDVYRAYELYTRAKAHQRAHELAVSYLAPEAVLRGELDFLTRVFTSLDASLIEDFSIGGQLFIDYARIVTRVPELREKLLDEEENAVPDAAEASELEMLSARIPRLIEVLPDVLHDKPDTEDQCKATLSRMLSRLLECVDPSVPLKIDIPTGLVEEGARIKHIHASAYGSLMRTIEEMA